LKNGLKNTGKEYNSENMRYKNIRVPKMKRMDKEKGV
jgi:hypothetical protein